MWISLSHVYTFRMIFFSVFAIKICLLSLFILTQGSSEVLSSLYLGLVFFHYTFGKRGILFYLCPSVQDIFRRIFLSNCWWQKSDIWSQASYRYTILWVAFLDLSNSYFLFANQQSRQTGSRNLMEVGPKTLPMIWGTYMKLVTKYQISAIDSCWEKCDEKCAYMFNVYKNHGHKFYTGSPYRGKRFFDPSDSYSLFAEERGYQ
jgi:hypothetical protein